MMAGKTELDTGALTSEQQDKLRQFKVVNRLLRPRAAGLGYGM